MPGNILPNANYVRKFFKYEIITPLTPENTKTITDILNNNNINVVRHTGIMGTTYYGITDSNGKMLCFGEFEEFDRPCESYRICLGDYKAAQPIEIASLNCWYKDVLKAQDVKNVRIKKPEKQILDMYNAIKLHHTHKK